MLLAFIFATPTFLSQGILYYYNTISYPINNTSRITPFAWCNTIAVSKAAVTYHIFKRLSTLTNILSIQD